MRRGLSQTDFGALAGVTRTAQLNYEKGDRSPDADYLMALMGHGVDVMYLLSGVPAGKSMASITAEQVRVLGAFDQLGDEERQTAFAVLDALRLATKHKR